MSFDLGVWYSEKAPNIEEAGRLYRLLCEQTLIPTESYPQVEAFYRALCSAYPEIDTLPENQLEDCPWSCAHDKSGFHVLISMTYGDKLLSVAQLVTDLAAEHSLICFDPQGPSVYLPPALTPLKKWYQFWRKNEEL